MQEPVRDLFRQQVKPQAFDDPRCRAVAELVYWSMTSPIRVPLREAALVARYSPQHFSEFFHERVGLSFDSWQFAVRMNHAETLLALKPWMQVDAISQAIGYSDLSAFSRAFKRYAGINCRQFRWLIRTCPRLVEELPAIEGLDNAYILASYFQKHPDTGTALCRVAEILRDVTSE